MLERALQADLEASLRKFPVVGIVGSRQTGKTTLAKTVRQTVAEKSVYLDLELPSDLHKLQSPELYLRQFSDRLVIIDEIQRMPELFPLLRALVDQKRSAGRFLILGSASPEMIKHASESLAGRIVYHELSPFTLVETGLKRAEQLWLRGGYPSSFLSNSDEGSFAWRESFIRTYLEMDLPQLGIRVPAPQIRRFWTMLAHLHGQLWNASRIAGSLGITAPTVKHYLDILEETFVVRVLAPWHTNAKKRLVKSPKVFIRDAGLLHALLRVPTVEDLQSHPTVGSSWEGFVIEQIVGMIPREWQAHYYRTGAGAEIDLLLHDRRGRSIAVEVKLSATPQPAKGFWAAMNDLSCRKGFVVYPGKERYPLAENVSALPLKDLASILE
jgi:predicted AAA+ superfamily ATPase